MAILSHPEPLFGGLLIRPARPGEEDIVLDLLAEAAAWLRAHGVAQWPARFPTESVQAQIAVGEALLVEDADHSVATLAVGYRIIDWVAGKAAERGWRHVRLATASDNPALRRYY